MEHLPPLSPAGQQFAIDVREKTFTHGDVVGKAFSRWLQEGFPFAEEVVGVHRAVQARDNVETLRRGDDKEIRDLLQVGATFERSEKWSADEINNAPRYAGAISTTVMTGRPREQSITDGSDSDTDLSIGMGKTSMYSPVTQILPDEEFSSFNFRARSALRLPSSEALGTDEVSEHSPERENAPRDDHMLGEQLGWEDWSQNPDVWTMESSKCVDSAYEEEDWRSESNRRLLAWTHEMFHR
ncbi:hypothetical protein diail_5906 [Diaporthe ilicicola]|nr:hypothetical protein diail_5906 [Diaporthe ilicicola]